MINYVWILTVNYPGKVWSLNGNSYEGIDWLDESPKPTQEELDALWESTQDHQAKQECKRQAKALLTETDWTTIPDVSDPASSPFLVNYDEFKQYRSTLRSLAVNPVAAPVFPTPPTEQWSS